MKTEVLTPELRVQIDKAKECFSSAIELYRRGERAEAKKIEKEGDIALKRAQQIFKEIKKAAKS